MDVLPCLVRVRGGVGSSGRKGREGKGRKGQAEADLSLRISLVAQVARLFAFELLERLPFDSTFAIESRSNRGRISAPYAETKSLNVRSDTDKETVTSIRVN